MKRMFVCAYIYAACLLTPLPVKGQAKSEFETSYNANFLKRSSLIDKDAPNMEVYDEKGNGFRLDQSRGKHTVVVFGCLT